METKMIEQGFNYSDSTIKEMSDFFKTRVEKMEPKEDRKKSLGAAKKSKKSHKIRKKEDFDSSVVESSEESTEGRCPNKSVVIYTENAVILWINARIYVRWLTNMSRKRKNLETLERATKS